MLSYFIYILYLISDLTNYKELTHHVSKRICSFKIERTIRLQAIMESFWSLSTFSIRSNMCATSWITNVYWFMINDHYLYTYSFYLSTKWIIKNQIKFMHDNQYVINFVWYILAYHIILNINLYKNAFICSRKTRKDTYLHLNIK